MRILHSADIHLDSPLYGLRKRAGARGDELANATRRAFENLIEHAIEQKVDLLVIAGDNYDGGHRDYGSLQFFASQMRRLQKAGIRVVMIRGNHDAENQLVLTLPDGIHLLSTQAPETIRFDDLKLAVHGQSYPRRDVKDNLAARYPDPVSGWFNLGVLHTAVEGFGGAHAPYAPCTLKELESKGYAYWALGHVHTRTEISTEPFIVYPGNLQARHVNEPGAKGASMLTIDDGKMIDLKHVPLDVVRWREVEVDLSGLKEMDELQGRMRDALGDAADGADRRTLAARITLRGETPLHARLKSDSARLDAEAGEAAISAGDVWIEQVEVRTSAPAETGVPDEAIAALDDAVKLLKLGGVEDGKTGRDELRAAVLSLPNRFTAALRKDAELDDLDDTALDAIIDDARDLLKVRLSPETKAGA